MKRMADQLVACGWTRYYIRPLWVAPEDRFTVFCRLWIPGDAYAEMSRRRIQIHAPDSKETDR